MATSSTHDDYFELSRKDRLVFARMARDAREIAAAQAEEDEEGAPRPRGRAQHRASASATALRLPL